MRRNSSHYGHAEAINRRARIGIITVVALAAGTAFGLSALGGGSDRSTPTVLALSDIAPLTVAGDATAAAATTPVSTTTLASSAQPPDSEGPTPMTAQPGEESVDSTTTSTTRPPAARTSRAPATTPTTTTLPPTTTTTTIPPTTTTTTTTTTTIAPTTTTTMPPTTTTTVVDAIDTMHIHALRGEQGGSEDSPTVRFEVRIRNQNNKNVRGAVVTATITGVGNVASTTNTRGWAQFDAVVGDDDDVTITVTGVSHPEYVYAPGENVAGPSLTVEVDD